MTNRRPLRARKADQHLAEIHRLLLRNDRQMARLAGSLEQLLETLRDSVGTRPLRGAGHPGVESAESPPEL